MHIIILEAIQSRISHLLVRGPAMKTEASISTYKNEISFRALVQNTVVSIGLKENFLQ